MALTVAVSPKELERVASAAYEGKTLNVMLCTVGLSGFTSASPVSSWQSTEISGNGYSRATTTIATGSYSSANARYELPSFDAVFSASGSGFSYDTIVVFIDSATYPHSIITESPNVVLAAGQTQTYRIGLNTDD